MSKEVQLVDQKLIDKTISEFKDFQKFAKRNEEEYTWKAFELGKNAHKVYEEMGKEGLLKVCKATRYSYTTLFRWQRWSTQTKAWVEKNLKDGKGMWKQVRLLETPREKNSRKIDEGINAVMGIAEDRTPEEERACKEIGEELKGEANKELLLILSRVMKRKNPDTPFKVEVFDQIAALLKKIVKLNGR